MKSMIQLSVGRERERKRTWVFLGGEIESSFKEEESGEGTKPIFLLEWSITQKRSFVSALHWGAKTRKEDQIDDISLSLSLGIHSFMIHSQTQQRDDYNKLKKLDKWDGKTQRNAQKLDKWGWLLRSFLCGQHAPIKKLLLFFFLLVLPVHRSIYTGMYLYIYTHTYIIAQPIFLLLFIWLSKLFIILIIFLS